MSGKSRRKRSPLGGYSDIAHQALPDYVRQGAPCDVPTCSRGVTGSRTLTWVGENQKFISILIALCHEHINNTVDELMALLPALADLDNASGPTPYMDLR
jgi:hypothetical protein